MWGGKGKDCKVDKLLSLMFLKCIPESNWQSNLNAIL